MKTQTLLFVIFLFISSGIFAQDEFTLVKEGEKAPDFSYQTSDGKTVQFSDLKGKVVWLTFFATWCGPCRKELPHLEKQVYQAYKTNPDFELLVIGREHSSEELNKFQKETNLSLPFIADPKRDIYSLFAKQYIPRNFIIDRNGTIVVSSVGFNETNFNSQLKSLEKQLQHFSQ